MTCQTREIVANTRQKGEKAIVRFGIYSLTVNIILTATKFMLALATGSLSLRADAVHSLVDVVASVALIIGLVISRRKSPGFPYGLYKVENLVATVISLLLFFTSYEIVTSALSAGPTTSPYGYWVIVVVAVLIAIPFFFGRYELNAGKRFNSPSLMADGSQFRADVYSSSIVLVGLAGQMLGFPLDKITALIVVLFIVYAAWGLLLSSMRVLLDASVSNNVLEKIRSLILAEPLVSSVRSLVGRNSGRFIFVEASITVRTSDLKKAYLVTEKIEQAIRGALPNIDRVLIHYEPETKVQVRYAVALSDLQGHISSEFGKSAYFALVDLDTKQNTVLRQEIVANPYRDFEKGRGIKVAEFLITYKPDVVIVKESLAGKGPGYALADVGTKFMQTNSDSMDGLLDELSSSLTEK